MADREDAIYGVPVDEQAAGEGVTNVKPEVDFDSSLGTARARQPIEHGAGKLGHRVQSFMIVAHRVTRDGRTVLLPDLSWLRRGYR